MAEIVVGGTELYPIAARLAQEGHAVTLWVGDSAPRTPRRDVGVRFAQHPRQLPGIPDLLIGGVERDPELERLVGERGGLMLGVGRLVNANHPERAPKLVRSVTGLPFNPVGEDTCWFAFWLHHNGHFSYFLDIRLYKRLLDGDRGVDMGVMGAVARVRQVEKDALASTFVHGLAKVTGTLGYAGPVSIAVQDGIVTRFACGLAPWVEILLWEALGSHAYPFYVDLAEGKDPRDRVAADWAGELLILGQSQEDFVNAPAADKHVYEVLDGPFVAVVSARGATPNEVRRRIYRTVRNARVSLDAVYRTDIGRDLLDDRALHAGGTDEDAHGTPERPAGMADGERDEAGAPVGGDSGAPERPAENPERVPEPAGE